MRSLVVLVSDEFGAAVQYGAGVSQAVICSPYEAAHGCVRVGLVVWLNAFDAVYAVHFAQGSRARTQLFVALIMRRVCVADATHRPTDSAS
jgi:hypothetical protein